MEKITITRGLTTLKTLDKKIAKATRAGNFVTFEVNNKKETDINAVADLQKVTDLINYRDSLKSAIAASNAVTIVKVGRDEMTVVAAIEKKTSVAYKAKLLQTLQVSLSEVRQNIDYHNSDAERRLDKLIEASVGSDSNKKDDSGAIDAISKPFMKRNEATMVDPLKIEDVISKLDEEIEDFLVNVDVSLSESNATTYIEV